MAKNTEYHREIDKGAKRAVVSQWNSFMHTKINMKW